MNRRNSRLKVEMLLSLTCGLSGWDGHGCQSCVLLRVSRLSLLSQYVLGGEVVGKVRLVGAVYLVVWSSCWDVGIK